MLTLTIPKRLIKFDEEHNRFIYSQPAVITLEHSLVSISKWEAKYHKAFLKKDEKSIDEWLYYIQCMAVPPTEINDSILAGITQKNVDDIIAYIQDPMTATTFNKSSVHRSNNAGSFITNEVIYYSMFKYNIPIECENWHLNRLITLISVFNEKEAPPKKRSQQEIWSEMDAINRARRKKWNTRG